MGASEREHVAREALLEITPASTVGELLGESTADDGVLGLSFAATVSGYPGWQWSVSVVELDGAEPTVLEAELLPAEGALLAPDWVPWSQRLEEYRAAQAAAGAEDDEAEGLEPEGDDESDSDDLDPDELDSDDLDSDELVSDIDDVIDYVDDEASALLAVGEDEEDEAEAEADDGGPEPADEPGLDDR